MKRLRAMKRSTLFALLAVLLIVLVPAIVLAIVEHDDPANKVKFGNDGDLGNIRGHTTAPNSNVTITSDIARLLGKRNPPGTEAQVAAFAGGSVGVFADTGAQFWVVGSASQNDGDVIIVLGN